MNRIDILNAFYGVLCELRVARALINDQVRGTNDVKFDAVKDIDRSIEQGEKALKSLRNIPWTME